MSSLSSLKFSLRKQDEVADHLWPKFQEYGKIYSKSASAFIRKAKRGEHIVTTIDQKEETKYSIDDDDMYVIMGKVAGECYCLTSKEFEENYITEEPMEPQESHIRDMGYKEYKSRRQIQVLEVTIKDMEFFGTDSNGEAHFIAPWGESTLVEERDILATTFPLNDKREVYRIARSVFEETYEQTQTQTRTQKEVFAHGPDEMMWDPVSESEDFTSLPSLPFEDISLPSQISSYRKQDEVADRFWPKFQKDGKIYSKNASAYIRKATIGEKIVTTVYGKVETEYFIVDDETYVVMGMIARECYCLTSKEFEENYIKEEPMELQESTMRDMGFKEYKSKRQIKVLEVTAEDMEFFGIGSNGEAHFIAPWGESTLVEERDILATTFPLNDKREVYRIARSVFEATYEQTQTQTRTQQEVSQHFAQNLRETGDLNRKAVTSFIRKGRRGETVKIKSDGADSSFRIDDDDSYVVLARNTGEQYRISKQEFLSFYEGGTDISYLDKKSFRPILDNPEFKEYKSRNRAFSRAVTEADMAFFRFNQIPTGLGEAYFEAPWGERLVVNTGDYLVMPVSPDPVQVYRIGKREFEMTFMKDNGPTMLDVLCERGGRANHHPGNQEYLKLMWQKADQYTVELAQNRPLCREFTQSIVREIKGWGGRFMKKIDNSDRWFEVDDETAMKKIKQKLRDIRSFRHKQKVASIVDQELYPMWGQEFHPMPASSDWGVQIDGVQIDFNEPLNFPDASTSNQII